MIKKKRDKFKKVIGFMLTESLFTLAFIIGISYGISEYGESYKARILDCPIAGYIGVLICALFYLLYYLIVFRMAFNMFFKNS